MLGAAPAIARDPLAFFEANRSRGPVYSFWMRSNLRYAMLVHVLTDPAAVGHVLKTNAQNYRKSAAYRRLGRAVGQGLLTSEGDLWRGRRRVVAPAFRAVPDEVLAGEVMRGVRLMLEDSWLPAARAGRPVDVGTDARRLALAVVGRALMSEDLARRSDEVVRAVRYFLSYGERHIRAVVPVPDWIPTRANRRFRWALGVMDELVYRTIDMHLRVSDSDSWYLPRDDFVARIVAATDPETGKRLDRRAIRDEVMTMLIAGHETTANALAWAFYLLATHPEVQDRLAHELADALDGREPRHEDLRRLPYTGRVFREALRLYPPAWMLARIALADDTISGYRIPAGSRVAVSPYLVHRDPRLWREPEAFDPDRFAPGGEASRLPEFAYFPFGGGPRACVGRNFAALEACLVLAAVAQRFAFEPPGRPVNPTASVTLLPERPIRLRLRLREGGAT